MHLIDVLSVIKDTTNTFIIDNDTRQIKAIYDGKNSIETEYNDSNVIEINANNNSLQIVIKGVQNETL